MITLHAFDNVVPQVKVAKMSQAGQSVEARYLVEAQDLKRIPGGGGRGGQRDGQDISQLVAEKHFMQGRMFSQGWQRFIRWSDAPLIKLETESVTVVAQ